jgi:hypothetical protein
MCIFSYQSVNMYVNSICFSESNTDILSLRYGFLTPVCSEVDDDGSGARARARSRSWLELAMASGGHETTYLWDKTPLCARASRQKYQAL